MFCWDESVFLAAFTVFFVCHGVDKVMKIECMDDTI